MLLYQILGFAGTLLSIPSAIAQSSNSVPLSTFISTTAFPSSQVVAYTTVRSGRTVRSSYVSVTTVTKVATAVITASVPASSSVNATQVGPSPTPSAAPIQLDTKIDAAFGVLGVVLMLSGLPLAFWGHKNRWFSSSIVGFYTLALVCFLLILNFGILPALNPPSETLRGLFVLASFVAGTAGVGIAIFFWQATKYFLGAWGGLCVGLFIQCFSDGGLIKPIGYRWTMYICCAAVGFILCTVPKLHWHILLVSTAFFGATVFILGIDCFTTAGLKEFYLWNIGFASAFPKYTNNGIQFPVTQIMQIELGFMGAVALMGGAVQFRILVVLQRKLKQMSLEQQKRDAEAELGAARQFEALDSERAEWEKDHRATLVSSGHTRNTSGYSSDNPMVLKGGGDSALNSPVNDEKRFSFFDTNNRSRQVSTFSEYRKSQDELKRSQTPQSAGLLAPMDLGSDLQRSVPSNYLKDDDPDVGVLAYASALNTDIAEKEVILAEIRNLRRSIDVLRSDSLNSEQEFPRAATRTQSLGAESASRPAILVHPSSPGGSKIQRVQSMKTDTLTSAGADMDRPKSVPLVDHSEWDAYVRERQLLQPPAGVSPPIVAERITVSPAIKEALEARKQREGRMQNPVALPPFNRDSVNEVATEFRTSPVIAGPSPVRPTAKRVSTYDELQARHRDMMRRLQGPLTEAVEEEAKLENAKARWERAVQLEKREVTRRQSVQAAALVKTSIDDKRRKSADNRRKLSDPEAHPATATRRTSKGFISERSRSPTQTHAKRMSSMKVEDWQQFQQLDRERRRSLVTDPAPSASTSQGARPVGSTSPIPFPNARNMPRNGLGAN